MLSRVRTRCPKIDFTLKIKENYFCFSLTNPQRGLVNHTRRVCPEGVKRPEGCRSKKKNEPTILA